MAVPVNVVNVTGTGAIQAVTIPSPVCSVSIRGRTVAVEIYDSATGSDYFTIAAGASFGIDSHNLTDDTLYLKTTNGAIIEIIYQVRR